MSTQSGRHLVEAMDTAGETPLHTAAWTGSTAMSDLLVTKGANLQAREREGLTPLLEAQGSGKAARKEGSA